MLLLYLRRFLSSSSSPVRSISQSAWSNPNHSQIYATFRCDWLPQSAVTRRRMPFSVSDAQKERMRGRISVSVAPFFAFFSTFIAVDGNDISAAICFNAYFIRCRSQTGKLFHRCGDGIRHDLGRKNALQLFEHFGICLIIVKQRDIEYFVCTFLKQRKRHGENKLHMRVEALGESEITACSLQCAYHSTLYVKMRNIRGTALLFKKHSYRQHLLLPPSLFAPQAEHCVRQSGVVKPFAAFFASRIRNSLLTPQSI